MSKIIIERGVLNNGLRWEASKDEKLITLKLYSTEKLKEGESREYIIDEAPWSDCLVKEFVCDKGGYENPANNVYMELTSEAICPKINSFTVNYNGNKSETHVMIKEGVTKIVPDMFYGCRTLKSLTIPKSLKWVSEYSFDKCNQFDAVYIFDLKTWCTSVFDYANPLRCGRNLYLNGKKVEDLVIPGGLRFLPNYAFSGCESIKSVRFEEPVEWIGNSTFNGCVNLKEIILPEGVTQIGRYAFEGCESLEKVVFPSTLTSVAEHAFRGCVNIKVLEFSGKPPYLRNDIFEDAKDLNRVITQNGEFKSYYDVLSVDGVCQKECDEKMRKLCARLRGNESPYGFVVCSNPKLYLGDWAGKRAYIFQMQGDKSTCYEENARPYSETNYVDYWIYIPDEVNDENAYDYALNHPKEWKRYVNTEIDYDI